jgi:hypothetical protein
MKLTFTFEEDDFREMITSYFAKNGFKAKDLDGLVDKFNAVYPDGIKVDADPAEAPAPSPPASPAERVYGPTQFPPEPSHDDNMAKTIEELEEKLKEDPGLRMSLSDLLNPEKTFPDDTSTSSLEIEHILQESEKYKNV